MTSPLTFDVIVVGGGLVGLSTALCAAQAGYQVALIEQQHQPTPLPTGLGVKPRVSAINAASQNLLMGLNIWQLLPQERLQAFQSMLVWDGQGAGEIQFSAEQIQQPALGHIIENDVLTAVLWQQVEANEHIDIHWGTEVVELSSATPRQLSLNNGLTLTASLVCGCEGRQSRVVALADLPQWQWSYQQTALVTTISHTQPHQSCARQRFIETGPLAFLPLPTDEQGRPRSSIVWSCDTAEAERLLAMPEADFVIALNQASEGCLGEIDLLDRRYSFPLAAQQNSRYIEEGLAIVGDAAHAIHPLAGLGANLGFLDVGSLSDALSYAKKHELSPGDVRALRRYQRERLSHNLVVAGLMEGFKRLFGSNQPLAVLARNLGLKQLNQQPLLKHPFILGAAGYAGVALPTRCQPGSAS